MNRRKFGLMGACGAAALSAGVGLPKLAKAGVPASQAAQLKTTLTPFGAERAGNADGSIPAWTGGLSEVAPGWTPGQPQPDYFANDALVLSIDRSNMAEHADMLSKGIQTMMTKYDGFGIRVYPTHRTAAAPQYVYDNIYQNALNASLNPKGGRFGFQGAYGGAPFPILDPDPNVAGIQIIWNHLVRFEGQYTTGVWDTYIVAQGNIALGSSLKLTIASPYYDPAGSLADFSGWFIYYRADFLGPPVSVGEVIIEWISTKPYQQPTQAWQLLDGEGRVRKAPQLTYDTPEPGSGGGINFDESHGIFQSPDRYNWTLLGKKEMYVPYNNNRFHRAAPSESIQPHYVNPELVRYEKHRVYIVDAVLAPGNRNVIAHRRLYIDEDTWGVLLTEEYDGNGNMLKVVVISILNVPSIPANIQAGGTFYNVQANSYDCGPTVFTSESKPGLDISPIRQEVYNPAGVAAAAQY